MKGRMRAALGCALALLCTTVVHSARVRDPYSSLDGIDRVLARSLQTLDKLTADQTDTPHPVPRFQALRNGTGAPAPAEGGDKASEQPPAQPSASPNQAPAAAPAPPPPPVPGPVPGPRAGPGSGPSTSQPNNQLSSSAVNYAKLHVDPVPLVTPQTGEPPKCPCGCCPCPCPKPKPPGVTPDQDVFQAQMHLQDAYRRLAGLGWVGKAMASPKNPSDHLVQQTIANIKEIEARDIGPTAPGDKLAYLHQVKMETGDGLSSKRGAGPTAALNSVLFPNLRPPGQAPPTPANGKQGPVPVIHEVVPGDGEVEVIFFPPAALPGQHVVSYTVIAHPGPVTETSSPGETLIASNPQAPGYPLTARRLVLAGLANGKLYSVRVLATLEGSAGTDSVRASMPSGKFVPYGVQDHPLVYTGTSQSAAAPSVTSVDSGSWGSVVVGVSVLPGATRAHVVVEPIGIVASTPVVAPSVVVPQPCSPPQNPCAPPPTTVTSVDLLVSGLPAANYTFTAYTTDGHGTDSAPSQPKWQLVNATGSSQQLVEFLAELLKQPQEPQKTGPLSELSPETAALVEHIGAELKRGMPRLRLSPSDLLSGLREAANGLRNETNGTSRYPHLKATIEDVSAETGVPYHDLVDTLAGLPEPAPVPPATPQSVVASRLRRLAQARPALVGQVLGQPVLKLLQQMPKQLSARMFPPGLATSAVTQLAHKLGLDNLAAGPSDDGPQKAIVASALKKVGGVVNDLSKRVAGLDDMQTQLMHQLYEAKKDGKPGASLSQREKDIVKERVDAAKARRQNEIAGLIRNEVGILTDEMHMELRALKTRFYAEIKDLLNNLRGGLNEHFVRAREHSEKMEAMARGEIPTKGATAEEEMLMEPVRDKEALNKAISSKINSAYNKAQAIREDVEAKQPQADVDPAAAAAEKEPKESGPEPPHEALRDALLKEAELEKEKLTKMQRPGKAALVDGKRAQAIVDEAVVDMNTAEMARQAKETAQTELADDDAKVPDKAKQEAERVNEEKIGQRQARSKLAAQTLADMRKESDATTDTVQADAIAAEKERVKEELSQAMSKQQ